MAKRGRKGGSSAARSAAAKKGWETRRRGGAGAAGKASKPTAKTTSARGRARAAETRARAAVKGGGGSKATRSLLTAQRARDFYRATGTGTKRSSAGSKPAKSTAKSSNNKVAGLKRDVPLMVESIRATRRQIRSGRNPGGDNLKAELGMRKTALRNRIKQIRSEQPKQAKSARPAKSTAAARPAKMSKAPANAAKSKYKAAKSQARELRMYRGGKSDAVVKKAEAKVKRMERTRRASRSR